MITYNGETLPAKIAKVILESAALVADGLPPHQGYPEERFENSMFTFTNVTGGIMLTIRPDRFEKERLQRRVTWLENRFAEATYKIPPEISGNEELMKVAYERKNRADAECASIAAEIGAEKSRLAKIMTENIEVFFPWDFFKDGVSINSAVKKWRSIVTKTSKETISTLSDLSGAITPTPSGETEEISEESSPVASKPASPTVIRRRGRMKKT